METGNVYPRATAHYVELLVFHRMLTKQSHHSHDAQSFTQSGQSGKNPDNDYSKTLPGHLTPLPMH